MNVIRRGGEQGWSGEWESGTGSNGGISFSSNACWGWGCQHVGETVETSGEWGVGGRLTWRRWRCRGKLLHSEAAPVYLFISRLILYV